MRAVLMRVEATSDGRMADEEMAISNERHSSSFSSWKSRLYPPASSNTDGHARGAEA
jgi:hypothetical protein